MRSNSIRKSKILSQIQEKGEVRVESLALQFETSEVTIRKDLSDLEAKGLLVRRFGGAVSLPIEQGSSSLLSQSPIKLAIAKAAAALIKNNNRIIIDSGRTTNALLPFLCNKSGLVVMTNALNTAQTLSTMESEPTLLMPGGTWDKQSESFQGRLAEKIINEYDFDQLFIGADGIDLNKGTTTFNELIGLSQAMAASSKEVIVIAESKKVGRKLHNVELPWQAISYFITDEGLSMQALEKIQSHDVIVKLVKI